MRTLARKQSVELQFQHQEKTWPKSEESNCGEGDKNKEKETVGETDILLGVGLLGMVDWCAVGELKREGSDIKPEMIG